MKILILGASGQLGSSLYNYLKIKVDVVHGTSRTGKNGLIKFDPFKDLWEFPEIYDVVINCIGAINETKNFNFEKIHLGLSELIIKNQFRLGSPRIIQVSVVGADSFSPIDFFRSKGQADEYLLSHPDTMVVRPSIICTPSTMMVRKLRLARFLSKLMFNRLPVPEGFPKHMIQPVMVDDLVKVIYKLTCEKIQKQIINVSGPETITYSTLFHLANKKIRFINLKRPWMDKLIKSIHRLLPDLINRDQYRLLFTDNIAENAEATMILGRPLGSTIGFWERELKS